ncbi:MAG: hypothetical protein WBE72_10085 [Terracidiphilus sp.]
MRKSPATGHTLRAAIWLALVSVHAAAQFAGRSAACPSPEVVLQRYVEAVGGKAALDLESRTITAKESECCGFTGETEYYMYKFKWKAPNRVTASDVPYFINILPVWYPNGVWRFDGESWSDFLGRKPFSDGSQPQQSKDGTAQQQREAKQRALTARYLYNEEPEFLAFRVAADPLVLIRANELYSSFEVDSDSTETPGLCVLRANQVRLRRNQRQDILSFDAASGLLSTWIVQTGFPPQNTPVQFRFQDYRQVGATRFPFYVYLDFHEMTFRSTSVVQNKPLPDSVFVAKPERP